MRKVVYTKQTCISFLVCSNKTNEIGIAPNAGYGLVTIPNTTAVQ